MFASEKAAFPIVVQPPWRTTRSRLTPLPLYSSVAMSLSRYKPGSGGGGDDQLAEGSSVPHQ